MNQLAYKFKASVVPWFIQWDKFVKDQSIWHNNVSEDDKKDLMKLIVEMQIDNYNKTEEYLKKCFDALFVMIDAQIKVLEDKAAAVTTPDTPPVTSLTTTSVTAPVVTFSVTTSVTKSTDPTGIKTSTASEPKHEEKKEEDKPKESLSKTAIAFICIGIALAIIGVGIGAYYAYKRWKKNESHDTITFEHYNVEENKEEV